MKRETKITLSALCSFVIGMGTIMGGFYTAYQIREPTKVIQNPKIEGSYTNDELTTVKIYQRKELDESPYVGYDLVERSISSTYVQFKPKISKDSLAIIEKSLLGHRFVTFYVDGDGSKDLLPDNAPKLHCTYTEGCEYRNIVRR